MKRRTFLKGLFATTVALPILPALGTVHDKAYITHDYSFTISKVEVIKQDKNFSRLVRGLATLDSDPSQSCGFAYEIYDDNINVIDTFDNVHESIRVHFIHKKINA